MRAFPIMDIMTSCDRLTAYGPAERELAAAEHAALHRCDPPNSPGCDSWDALMGRPDIGTRHVTEGEKAATMSEVYPV